MGVYSQLRVYYNKVLKVFETVCFSVAPQLPLRAMASFMGFLDHTQRHNTFSRTFLDEWSVLRGDFYLTTHNTTTHRNPCTPGGIRTQDSKRRTSANLRLWSQSLRDRYL